MARAARMPKELPKGVRARKLASGQVLYDRRVYFPDGSQRYAHGHTLDELAIDYAKLLRARDKAGKPSRDTKNPAKIKIGDLADMWMDEHVATLTPATDDYYRIQLTYRIEPYLYDVTAYKLTRRMIGKWRKDLMAEQQRDSNGSLLWHPDGSPVRVHSNRTINAATSTLKAMFGWALETIDDWDHNPLLKFKLLPEDTRGVEIHTPVQVMQMCEQSWRIRIAQTKIGRGAMEKGRAFRLATRDQTMMLALACLGVRMGELAGLRLRDYDDGRDRDEHGTITNERELGWMHLRQQVIERSGKTAPLKGKRHRRVPVLPGFRLALDWYLASMPPMKPNDFMFPGMRSNDQRSWRHTAMNKWRASVFAPAAKAVGLADCLPHDMRHTFATMMIEFTAGRLPTLRLAKYLGHTNTKLIEETYGHVYDEIADGLFAGLNAALFGDRAVTAEQAIGANADDPSEASDEPDED